MTNRFRRLFAATFLMCVLAGPVFASTADDAAAAYARAKEADYQARRTWQKVFAQVKPLAEQGDPKAERMLGEIFYYGAVGAPDRTKGIDWMTRAAEQGNASARLELAGFGAIQLSAEEKQKLTRAAAEQGDDMNQYALGSDYALGISGAKDDKEAFKWYFRSAEQGYVLAQSVVGGMYLEGRGVAPDIVQAYMWLSLTDLPAIPGLELGSVAAKMTPQQLARAKKLAAAWKPVMCRNAPGPCAYPKSHN